MISHGRRFVFVHISKTAGNSICRALGEYSSHKIQLRDNRTGRNQGLRVMRGATNIKHWSLAEYAEEWAIDDYFKFSCVRNPWDRILSLYCFRNGGFDGTAALADFIRQDETQATQSCTQRLSIDGEIQIDYCLRFERLQRDFDQLVDRIEIKRQMLPIVNKSSHKHYVELYDQETRQLIADRYQDDIENFGYEFGKVSD